MLNEKIPPPSTVRIEAVPEVQRTSEGIQPSLHTPSLGSSTSSTEKSATPFSLQLKEADDLDLLNISVAVRRLEQASSLEEIEAVSKLVQELTRTRREKLNEQQYDVLRRLEMEDARINRMKELEYQLHPMVQAKAAEDRKLARNLVYFKLGFSALMFASGVILALTHFAEVGFFMLGGAVTLLTETSFNSREGR